MKIVCCQIDTVWENKVANHKRALSLLAGASFSPGSLVVLPEMFATGFSMNVAAVAEGPDAPTQTFLARTARELSSWVLGGVVTAGKTGRGRNEAVLYSPEGNEVVRYCKMQPFTPGGEAKNYEAGNQILTFVWHGLVVAPFICYDLRFPELFRAAMRRGAQMFVVIASWPIARAHHWVTLLQARAIENQAYVVGVNRAGTDPNFTYPGRSLIVNPSGEIVADAGSDEGVISAECNLDELMAYRTKLPFLQDMRAEFHRLGEA
jgi:predicted amidohydrolase